MRDTHEWLDRVSILSSILGIYHWHKCLWALCKTDDVRNEQLAAIGRLAFLACAEDGRVYTPLLEGRAGWPDQAFEDDVAELLGVRSRVIGLQALIADKAEVRGDSTVAAKDRADSTTLSRLQ
jgi:hypothetical protein